jgi:DNA-binding MarR family transcriptional regulator
VADVLTMARKSVAGDGRADAGSRALRAGIDYGPLENWVGFHLRMAQIAAACAFARASGAIDLPPGRFALLTLIGRNPGISQTLLSRAAGCDKSTLTPALRDLTRRGLIVRARLQSDRRSYHLQLTAPGAAMLRRLTACAEQHERHLDRIIGRRERGRFLATLRRVMAELACGHRSAAGGVPRALPGPIQGAARSPRSQ